MRNTIAAGASAVAFTLALAAMGCASLEVSTEVESGADFSRFRSFAHAPQSPEEPPPGEGGLVREIVREEIQQGLEAKGYRTAPLEAADMVVAFRARGVTRTRIRNAGDPDADFYRVQSYTEGTLVIDFFDPGESRPVWHGVARADVFGERDARKAAKRAVRAILAEFPENARP